MLKKQVKARFLQTVELHKLSCRCLSVVVSDLDDFVLEKGTQSDDGDGRVLLSHVVCELGGEFVGPFEHGVGIDVASIDQRFR